MKATNNGSGAAVYLIARAKPARRLQAASDAKASILPPYLQQKQACENNRR